MLRSLKDWAVCAVYGQEDYVSRVCNYLRVIAPRIKIFPFAFPLQTVKSDQTVFDFTLHDLGLQVLSRDVPIVVAFSMKNHEKAVEHLKLIGFRDIHLYNAMLDNAMKRPFFEEYFKQCGMKFCDVYNWHSEHLSDEALVKIYLAKCETDQLIPDYPEMRSNHIVPIQVGAALTNQRNADVTDSTGDNISSRNRRYSEMTAFYWMWKNDKDADYLGLCHYRRLWVDLDIIVEKLQTADIDAVLPLPTICEHSVHEDYLLKYIPTVWQPMMEVMKRRSLDYYEAAQEIFKGKIFYASNMCILRRKVLDDLCKWMFPIVMEVEEIVGDIEDPYYNRYAGFCTERLITLYFLYNKHHWNLAHAEKVFIG